MMALYIKRKAGKYSPLSSHLPVQYAIFIRRKCCKRFTLWRYNESHCICLCTCVFVNITMELYIAMEVIYYVSLQTSFKWTESACEFALMGIWIIHSSPYKKFDILSILLYLSVKMSLRIIMYIIVNRL